MKYLKKVLVLTIIFISIVLLAGCGKKTFLVDFETGTNLIVEAQEIKKGDLVEKPNVVITKDGYHFIFWELDKKEFDFDTKVTENFTLVAKWEEFSNLEMEIASVKEEIYWQSNYIFLPTVGSLFESEIDWEYDEEVINEFGVVLFPKKGEQAIETEIIGTFKLDGQTEELRLNVVIEPTKELSIDNFKTFSFSNLTTEYEVDDGTLNLYFEKNGNVPYVKLVDFFELLKGFIDPDVDFTYTKEDNYLKIFYQYYDEDEDKTYDLICEIDVISNTITTNDPGFFWAYILETETNYGRHIFYDYDHEDTSYNEGESLFFELDKYGIYLGVEDGEVVLPFYLANQLFAGSSYYNVYFNGENLYGIYSLPDKDSDEYKTMKSSNKNNERLPGDLVAHNYHMLAFNLDYFYGLKDIMEVDSYYSYLEKYQKDLLSNNPRAIDLALAALLLKDIDEPHTSFGYPSYYNNDFWEGPSSSSLSDYGERFQRWYHDAYIAVDGAIERKWGRAGIISNQWSADSKNRPDYWFLDDQHAVLILDSFVTADIEESSKFENEIINKLLKFEDKKKDFLPAIDGGSKYYYYQNSDIDNKYVETLVYGLSESYLATYTNALINKGFEHVIDDSNSEIKQNGYFKTNINDEDFFIVIQYDKEYELFYMGITNQEAPEKYSNKWPLENHVKDVVNLDSAVYMEYTLNKIFAEKPAIESITLDLTWNSGGNVGALYRVLGFITDEAFRVSSYNRGTKGGGSTYVYIDGSPSYPNLKWSLLVSPKTFSAGNSMATIFKENKLGLIIGSQTGGGTSSITPILLPSGTAFIMSSNNISALREGVGTEEDPYKYVDNEFGIRPDFVLNMRNIYNEEKLLEILKNQ